MNLDASALSILRAVLALGALSLVMAGWMGMTRLPAMRAAGLKLQDAAHTADLNVLPSEARRIADNYNHLFEAPTVFYAVALAIIFAGVADPAYAAAAWAFVVLRVLHSLVQATINKVPLRLVCFVLSWMALGYMIVRPLLTLRG